MKYINAELKTVLRKRIGNIPAREITSYEEVQRLSEGTEVAIMHSCTMVLGEIRRCADTIWVHDGVDYITIRHNSFEYRNHMYEIL